MFSFSYDPDRTLLNVVQKGYWSMPMFQDYEQAYLAQHDRIRLTHKNYRVFSDCSEYPVQSTEVSEAFGKLFRKLLSENKGRCAIVAASTLNKMQARRAIPQPNVEVFTEADAAMKWLFLEDSPPA